MNTTSKASAEDLLWKARVGCLVGRRDGEGGIGLEFDDETATRTAGRGKAIDKKIFRKRRCWRC